MSMVFLRLIHEFTINRVFFFPLHGHRDRFSILLLETTPILSFLKFLLSILDMWLIIFIKFPFAQLGFHTRNHPAFVSYLAGLSNGEMLWVISNWLRAATAASNLSCNSLEPNSLISAFFITYTF